EQAIDQVANVNKGIDEKIQLDLANQVVSEPKFVSKGIDDRAAKTQVDFGYPDKRLPNKRLLDERQQTEKNNSEKNNSEKYELDKNNQENSDPIDKETLDKQMQEIQQELSEALEHWKWTQHAYNHAIGFEQVEFCIYQMMAAEQKYRMILLKAR